MVPINVLWLCKPAVRTRAAKYALSGAADRRYAYSHSSKAGVKSAEVMRWVTGCLRKCWSNNYQRKISMLLVTGIDKRKVYSQKALKKQNRAE